MAAAIQQGGEERKASGGGTFRDAEAEVNSQRE